MTRLRDFVRSLSRLELLLAAGCGLAALIRIMFTSGSVNGEPLVISVLVAAGLVTPAWYLLTRLHRALLLPRGEYWVWATGDALMRWYALRALLVVVKLLACILLSLPALAACLLLALLPARLLGTPEK